MPVFHQMEDVISYLAVSRIYPRINKYGKKFFSKSISHLNREEQDSIWKLLQIESKEDCDAIKEKIKQKISVYYPYEPIVRWQTLERPRERLLESGPENLSNAQLLAILLRTGTEGFSAQDLAKQLLSKFTTLRSLNQASKEELNKFQGLGPAKIAQLKAAMEIGRRLSIETISKKAKLINPEKVKQYIESTLHWNLRDSKKEMFAIVFLDTKLKPISHFISTIGSNKESVVDISDIIRRSTQANASAVILIHNHPSGETDPSPEDIDSTRRVIQACQLVGILVVDHVIVGSNPDDMFSFASHKII